LDLKIYIYYNEKLVKVEREAVMRKEEKRRERIEKERGKEKKSQVRGED
jgi:hypothetical protein